MTRPARTTSWTGEATVRLIELAGADDAAAGAGTRRDGSPRPPAAPAGPYDADLFELLKAKRREVAAAEKIPAYIVFADKVLQAFAADKPTTPDAMRKISGVGEVKLKTYGPAFLEVLTAYTAARPAGGGKLAVAAPAGRAAASPAAAGARKKAAFKLFRDRADFDDVVEQMGVGPSTVADYLAEYIAAERPADIRVWVADEVYQEVAAAAQAVGRDKLRPIYDALGGQVVFEQIKWTLAHQAAHGAG